MQVRTWTLCFEQMGEVGLQDRRGRRKKDQTPRTELEQAQIEIEQLKHKLYLSKIENTLLKIERGGEERCLWQVRQSHLCTAIKECNADDGYFIEAACKLLRVARSAYNKWASGKLGRRAAENEQLSKKLKNHTESHDKGYRRINDDLQHEICWQTI